MPTGDLLRWAIPTLINPIEPGTQADPAYPGRGVSGYTAPVSGFYNPVFDAHQDALLIDMAAGNQSGSKNIDGGRHVRVQGGDFTSAAAASVTIRPRYFSGSFAITGAKGDWTAGNEVDALQIVGNDDSAIRPTVFVQDCFFKGVHGRNSTNHSDGCQIFDGNGSHLGSIGEVHIDRFQVIGNYQCYIGGYRTTTNSGNFKAYLSRVIFQIDQNLIPHDTASTPFVFCDKDSTTGQVSAKDGRKCDVELAGVYCDVWPGQTLDRAIFPESGSTVDGEPFGTILGTVNSRTVVSFPHHQMDTIQGYVTQYDSNLDSDFVDYGSIGVGYAWRGVDGAGEAPFPNAISLSASTLASGSPQGTHIAWLNVDNYPAGDAWIIDIIATDNAGNKVQIIGRELQAGSALASGNFDITLKATVRGQAKSVSKTFTISVT